jgi:hypothetical protein
MKKNTPKGNPMSLIGQDDRKTDTSIVDNRFGDRSTVERYLYIYMVFTRVQM